ncbi:MAG: O-antigen ligase family protein [Bacteroidota bacterium]|nr:O-antigen ligase family protein [Bacteroidota bacterium]
MKIINIISRYRPEIEKINFFFAIALAFFMPLFPKIIPKLIILWVITWLLEGNFKNKLSNIHGNIALFYIFISFFIYHIAGLLYSDNIKVSLFDLEVKLSLLIIPIVLITSNQIYTNKYNQILFAFFSGNLIASVLCIINGLIKEFVAFDNFHNLYYEYLSVFIHPSYFSMYIAMALIIMGQLQFEKYFGDYKWINVLFLLLVLFSLLMIYLLSSKTGIFSGTLALIFLLIYNIKKKINLKICIAFGIIISSFVIYSFYKNGRIINLTNQLRTTEINLKEKKFETSNDRLMIWYYSFEIIKKNFWFGVGNGDIKDRLIEEYKKNNFEIGVKEKLNAHNQYIETFIAQGFCGFIMLLLILIIPLFKSVNKNRLLLTSFIIIIGVNFFFESMLNTQAGVVFFSFFYSFFNFVDNA